ncbi:pentatricopeptide repeat-containing protein, partial [Trifolium pratense]
VADVDPLIEDLTRDKERFLHSRCRLREVHGNDLAKQPRVDPQSITPDLRIVGSWSDAVTDLDYIQDPSAWCGASSTVTASVVVLNPHVANDLEILRNWKDNEASDIGHRVYTDEEETAAAINYLKNRSAARGEPFIEVVSKAKKKIAKGISGSLFPFYGK